MFGPNGAGKTTLFNMAVDESLKSVNLVYGGVGDKLAGNYSGGMKRRLSVAISLIGDPIVVYMDEPSTGLDPTSRYDLWNVIKHAKQGQAIILTTHGMEAAEVLCDRLGIVVDGSLLGNPKVLKGSAEQFAARQPATTAVFGDFRPSSLVFLEMVENLLWRMTFMTVEGNKFKFWVPGQHIRASVLDTVLGDWRELNTVDYGIKQFVTLMFDTRTTRKGEYGMSVLRSLIEQGKVRNYSTVVDNNNNVLHSRAILEDIAMEMMMKRKLAAVVAVSMVDTEFPDMARGLGLLILLVWLIVWKAAIFQPVLNAHRSVALEPFAPIDGSFGSLEETYETVDKNPITCLVVVETLSSSSSSAHDYNRMLNWNVEDKILEAITSTLHAVLKDASLLSDFYHSIRSLFLIKDQGSQAKVLLEDANDDFHAIKALNQSDGKRKYASNGAEYMAYASGVALEPLAGTLTLVGAEVDQSVIGIEYFFYSWSGIETSNVSPLFRIVNEMEDIFLQDRMKMTGPSVSVVLYWFH